MKRDYPSKVASGENKIHVATSSTLVLKGDTSAFVSTIGLNHMYILSTL